MSCVRPHGKSFGSLAVQSRGGTIAELTRESRLWGKYNEQIKSEIWSRAVEGVSGRFNLSQ